MVNSQKTNYLLKVEFVKKLFFLFKNILNKFFIVFCNKESINQFKENRLKRFSLNGFFIAFQLKG